MNYTSHQTAPLKAHKPHTAPVLASSDLADLQLLAMKDLRTLLGRSESSIRDLIAAGEFPPADVRDGPRFVRWYAKTARSWLEGRASN